MKRHTITIMVFCMAAVLVSGNRKKMLQNVIAPTLVLHGDSDPLVPVECGVDTAQAIPGAKLEIIEGMGHALPKALWERVIDIIVDHVSMRDR